MAAGEASTKPRQEKQYDYLLKFLLVGDSDVGKQEILSGLEDGAAESPFCSGSAYKTTTILLDGKRVKLQLWDTSGQGRFCTIIRSYSRGAQGILLVYDITNKWSFDGIDRWLKEVEEHAPGVPKVLVGNRLHLAFRRQIGEREAEAYAAKNRMAFFEVSPLCDFNIRESFSELSRMALHRNGMERLWRSNKGDTLCTVNQQGDRGPISQQLMEVMELAGSTNRRLEDCAVEWQAKISQAQWKILDANPADKRSWQQSVLARTYFADKTLDDAFQGLVKHNKTFIDHLQNFIALIHGKQPTMMTRQTRNAQNQCSESGLGEGVSSHSSLLPTLDVPIFQNNRETYKSEKSANSALSAAQQSFTALIKAKIDFDSKFLGFEATLNGNDYDMSDPALCSCKICSKFLSCVMQDTTYGSTKDAKNVRRAYKKRTRCSNRIKQKRLKSTRISTRKNYGKVSEETVTKSASENFCSSNEAVVTM